MSAFFRVVLIIASISTLIYISRKLKKAQVNTHDTVYWILFSGLLIVLSLFPQIADWLAHFLEVRTTENAVFLIIIFALLIRVFLLTVKTSQMEHRMRILVEELAIREEISQENKKEKKTWTRPEMKFYYRTDDARDETKKNFAS